MQTWIAGLRSGAEAQAHQATLSHARPHRREGTYAHRCCVLKSPHGNHHGHISPRHHAHTHGNRITRQPRQELGNEKYVSGASPGLTSLLKDFQASHAVQKLHPNAGEWIACAPACSALTSRLARVFETKQPARAHKPADRPPIPAHSSNPRITWNPVTVSNEVARRVLSVAIHATTAPIEHVRSMGA